MDAVANSPRGILTWVQWFGGEIADEFAEFQGAGEL